MSGGGVMLTGWLKKSPPEKKMRRHSWKKRWFMLKSGRLSGDPNVLEYYKHQTAKKPIKSINLNDCIRIDINVPIKPDKKDPAHQFVFDIVTNSRTYYFVADSVGEMSSWVHCLCDLCGFNHDSNDKTNLGTRPQTFTAQPNISGPTSMASSLLPKTDEVDIPDPLPRPANTMSHRSKPVSSEGAGGLNGSVNPSWSPSTENGYDTPEGETPIHDHPKSVPNNLGMEGYSQSNGFSALPKIQPPIEDIDSSGYLHLANCTNQLETATSTNSDFLTVERNDERRCSTDSVFTHEADDDDSPSETSPGSVITPMTELLPQNSRFLRKVGQGRLSSMPDCPPPPPPTNVAPHRLGYSYPDDDDEEDNVSDARRRVPGGSFTPSPMLHPIDDRDLYKVPPNLQREYRVNEDGKPIGSTGGHSSSSYGSTGGGHGMEGRRSSGKLLVTGPEYINTQDGNNSGSFSGPSGGSHLPSASGSSLFSSPGLTPNSATQHPTLYDTPSPMSPIFPLNPASAYQVPPALERIHVTQHGMHTHGSSAMDSHHMSNMSVKRHLAGVQMLDVSAMTASSQPGPITSQPVLLNNPESMYSAPNSLALAPNSLYSSAHEMGIAPNVEGTYAVPPARPPKPLGPHFGGLTRDTGTISPSHTHRKAATDHIHSKVSEGMYASPRTYSSSSSSSASRDVGHLDSAQTSVYDTVRQQSPLSPPHATVIGTVSDDQQVSSKVLAFGNAAKHRKAISATNSPMATPDMTRRIEIGKRPSFSSKISPTIEQNKSVSGSAPSLYDVPQQLRSSPSFPETRTSQSSSTSADSSLTGSSARNSAADTSIYEVPKAAKPVIKDSLQKVDDYEHPSYERMSAQHYSDNCLLEHDDSNPYTIMAGAPTLMGTMTSPLHHAPTYPPQAWPKDIGGPDIPPPVHRDLKPGRRSLGSDGGSSQTGSDKRKNTSRDSYESDEAVSPPHTSIIQTLPIVTEPKTSRYVAGFSTATQSHSISSSVTSPQRGRAENLTDRLSVSPIPPLRPPKSSHSSLSPRTPPMATPVSQLPGRPYTPTHGGHHPTDRHFMTPSPSLPQGVPERPPKPANMKVHADKSNTQVWDDGGLSPPRRPPKASDDGSFPPSRPPKHSMTPSTGDSLFSGSSLHSGLFFPNAPANISSTTLVPPPPPEHQAEREIKYIEIKDFPTQNNVPVHLPLDVTGQDKPSESVEYIQLDAGKTRALEKMKMERQSKLQQRTNFEAASKGRK